jgi:hypothetical protein
MASALVLDCVGCWGSEQNQTGSTAACLATLLATIFRRPRGVSLIECDERSPRALRFAMSTRADHHAQLPADVEALEESAFLLTIAWPEETIAA